MYCTIEWVKPGSYPDIPGTQNYEHTVLQDARGDFYHHYTFSQGGAMFVGKFRVPRGTPVEDCLKNYYKGAENGVDMDRVREAWKHWKELSKERELAKLRARLMLKSVARACSLPSFRDTKLTE
jgi:hypothetical protein